MKSIFIGAIYLLTIPVVIFSGDSFITLVFSLILGFLLFLLYKSNSPKHFIAFLMLVLISLAFLKPRFGIDMGVLNSINSQRGEHANFETSIYPKLLHNKADLLYSFVENISKLISPVAIFAHAYWHNISRYYPLGFLFPWDIYFIYLYLKSTKTKQKTPTYFFFLAASLLIFLSGALYVDHALLFVYTVVFFLALLALQGYRALSTKHVSLLIALNITFVLYHLWITPYFKP